MKKAMHDISDTPHRRFNPLTGRWMLVSPHRAKRPWQGQQEAPVVDDLPQYDGDCYLCPGNTRVNGEVNPSYVGTYVFPNDFQALLDIDLDNDRLHSEASDNQNRSRLTSAEDSPSRPVFTSQSDACKRETESFDDSAFFKAQTVSGECRVVCYSPRHDLTLARMTQPDVERVVRVWMEQTGELGKRWRNVQIFENRGEVMGCSNPHPHGQIWSGDFLPEEVALEDASQREWARKHASPMLVEYASREMALGERVVCANETWLAVVPWWAVWPFETLILPLSPASRLTDLNEAQVAGLADVLRRLLIKYDNLFSCSFPYSMGWHQAPFGTDNGGLKDGEGNADCLKHDRHGQSGWTVHAHFYPPLLRSASVKKFMVGFEMMGEAQRDLTAEQAARMLREQPEVHFKEQSS